MISGPWGHDRNWEHSVVEKIRQGGGAPGMADTGSPVHWEPVGVNAGGWEFAEEHSKDAIRTNAVYLNDAAIAERELKRKLLRDGIREAQAKAAARAKKVEADRRARDAAHREAERRWQAEQAKRDERQRNAREEWELEARLHRERIRITSSKWRCIDCGGKSLIKTEGDGYRITCTNCAKTAWGSHGSLLGVINQ